MYSQKKKKKVKVLITQTPGTAARQALLSMVFPRQEYWRGLPFPSPGDIPDPGIELGLPLCGQMLYRLSHQGINYKST